MTKDLTEGSPIKLIWFFSLPVIGGNLFQLFYTLADTIIVGQTIGEKALSAVGSTTVIIYFILVYIQGLTNGFAILLAQAYGLKDKNGVKKSIVSAIYLSLGISILITALTLPLCGPIIQWMKIPEEIYEDSYSYLFIVLAGTITTVFYNMISNTLRALGDSRLPLIYLILSSVLNIVLDYILIVFCHMGVSGAAAATIISQFIASVLSFASSIKRYDEMKIEKRLWNFDIESILSHLKLGLLMGIQMSVMCIGQLVMQAAVNSLGTIAIAGYTAATKVDQLGVLVSNAFVTSIAAYAAQNYGAHRLDRIRKGVNASLIIVESCAIIMALLIYAIEPLIVPLFVKGPTAEIFSYAHDYFSVVLPFYPMLGLLVIYRTTDQAMNLTWVPLAACLAELLARCTSAVLLTKSAGYKGIAFSHPLAWCSACLIVIPAYYLYMKKADQKMH